MIKTEKILCSAIHYDNGISIKGQEIYGIKTGFVLCGYRHNNIMSMLPTNIHYKGDTVLNSKYWNENNVKHEEIQGFLTVSGKFVNRKDAMKIALECGQVKENELINKNFGLFSEDIY